jgi:hypothetical protein
MKSAGAEAHEALDRRGQLVGSDVEVHAILAGLGFRNPLEDELGAMTVSRDEHQVRLGGARSAIPDRLGPELSQAFRVLAVEDDDEPHARSRLPYAPGKARALRWRVETYDPGCGSQGEASWK